MKKASILVIALILPLFITAQGIHFQISQSLEEIKQMAKNESKYIFLDIYATWCVPCKMMERSVYNTDTAGNFFNANFISAKVQMDKTTTDSEQIKKWYLDAESINKKFIITSYPTFLFFSPEGSLVLRGSGYQSAYDLIKMGTEALDPLKNYTGLVSKYKNHQLSFPEMRELALKGLKMEDKSTAVTVAKDYKINYLDQLQINQLLTKENIDFIREFPDLVTTGDHFFELFCSNSSAVDSASKQNGLAKQFRDYAITRVEINDKIWDGEKPKNVNPNWQDYEKRIREKYSESIAKSILINARLRWHTYFKEWPEVVKYNIEYIESEPMDLNIQINRVMLNNTVYDVIFKHSNDPVELRKGINWIKQLLNHEPEHYSWVDTYSNLLYKLGKKQKAIKMEEKALEMATAKKDMTSINEYKTVISRMKKGLSTW